MRTVRKLALVTAALLLITAPAIAQETPTTVPDAFSMTTPYPSISVEAGDQASFDLTIVAPEPTPVSLTATGLPDGWTATFRGGGFEIGGVTAGPTAPEVSLDVSVPVDAAEGAYDIEVSAEGGSASASLSLFR